MARPANELAPSSCQEAPPSALLSTPTLRPARPELLNEPVPAYTTSFDRGVAALNAAPSLSSGLILMSPIDSDGNWSVSGVQLVPPSVVRQTPPFTDPANITLPLNGCTASDCTAPTTGLLPGTAAWALRIGPGPCWIQDGIPCSSMKLAPRKVSTLRTKMNSLLRFSAAVPSEKRITVVRTELTSRVSLPAPPSITISVLKFNSSSLMVSLPPPVSIVRRPDGDFVVRSSKVPLTLSISRLPGLASSMRIESSLPVPTGGVDPMLNTLLTATLESTVGSMPR